MGIIAAAKAIQKKFNIPDGTMINLIPDQQFGEGAAPKKAPVMVNGNKAWFFMNPIGNRKISKSDPAHGILSNALAGISDNIYRTKTDDLVVIYKTAEDLKNNPVNQKTLEQLARFYPDLYGVTGIAPGAKVGEVESSLISRSYEGSEAGCVATLAVIAPIAKKAGILAKPGADGSIAFDLISPHHANMSDTGEKGSIIKSKLFAGSGDTCAIMSVAFDGSLYFDKDEKGKMKQFSLVKKSPTIIQPAKKNGR
ncbi:MAG: hypothetical protein FWD15_03910 [Alphaproteobacteria bacterium]|nr:hypothetical protein [Alphaproteobacteria bacterium]